VADSGPAGTFAVQVSGLRSAEDYARVLAYFGQLSVVRESRVLVAQGDVLELELDLRTGLSGLRQLVANGQTLEAEGGNDATGRFRLMP
jgi:hypothetical protein